MAKDPRKPSPPRDRVATQARIIEAVGSILAKNGFTALGVNAVAREAGVDKVLVYRYFGGLGGLIEAFGRDGNFWPTLDELAGGDVAAYAALPLREKLHRLARNFLRGIQRRPLTQEIMAWEMVERNELTERLEVIRETRMLQFYETFFPADEIGVDLVAVSAIFGGAISYLVTRSRKIQWYGGVNLQTETGWERLTGAMDTIVDGLLHIRNER